MQANIQMIMEWKESLNYLMHIYDILENIRRDIMKLDMECPSCGYDEANES